MRKPMYDQGASVQIAQVTGDPNDIQRYNKNRRCKLCKKKLNSYTPGPYCLSHEHKGAMMDIAKAEARKKKMQKKAQEKHKAMLDAKRGNKPKKTWNKVSIPSVGNTKCIKCGKSFTRKKNAISLLTKEYCLKCRKIERTKDGI